MRIGCFQSCACISACYESAQYGLGKTICELDEMLRDPEAFQKVCIVIRSAIQGMNLYFHTNYFPDLIKVLNVTESFDFYGFCRLPRYLSHPYLPDRLDEYAILDQLEVILCDNWHLGIPDDAGQNRDPAVQAFAEEQLKALLEGMVMYDQDLHSEEKVKQLLLNRLIHALEVNPIDDFDPHNINLNDLKIPLKPSTWLDVLTDSVFIGIDIACVPAFLSDWSLLDLSYYADQMGTIPLFHWMPGQVLDEWIWRAMRVGYGLQFFQAFFNLYQGELTADERIDAKWQMAASLAEGVYATVILQKREPKIVVCCAFIAKSLGLLRFMLAPKPTFFTASDEVA